MMLIVKLGWGVSMIKYWRLENYIIVLCVAMSLSVPSFAQTNIVGIEKDSQAAANASEIKSLFFSDADIKLIYDARLVYEQNQSGKSEGKLSEDNFLKSLDKISVFNVESPPNSFTYPQFFLASIAYYSPDDWVVWVNNTKITKDSSSVGGLRVVDIDKKTVHFEWDPERMDKIVDANDYSLDSPVKVNFMRNMVEFSLKANQTFTSYAMRVVEGKVLPVTISTNSSEKIIAK
jgi:hypothetical protein